MQKKIETMIAGIGELSISAIATWFPSKSREEIIGEIEKSDKLVVNKNINFASQAEKDSKANKSGKVETVVLDNEEKIEIMNLGEESEAVDFVDAVEIIDMDVNEVKDVEKVEEIEVIEDSEIVEDEDLSVEDTEATEDKNEENEEEEVEKTEELNEEKEESEVSTLAKVEDIKEMTLPQLTEIIEMYNKRVKEEYKRSVNRSYENILAAVLCYYEKRFKVEKNDFIPGDGANMYTLKHLTKGVDVAYLYVGEYLTKSMLDRIIENFEYETVYFCVTKYAEVSPNLSTREFYLKNVEEIAEEYLSKYKLIENKLTILKIEEE